jgi:hypothetical protein
MLFWNFWKSRTMRAEKLRKIKTLRGQKSIDKAIANGTKLMFRNVEPFSVVKGKYCMVKNNKSGKEFKIRDFRDKRGYSDEFEIAKDWTYQYYHYKFPQEAAYIIPNDIEEGEKVIVVDLIENFLSYYYNQGGGKRLKSCKAIWENNDLQIQYDPDSDCIKVVG